MLGSLRSRVLSGMGLLLVLVLALAMLAVNTSGRPKCFTHSMTSVGPAMKPPTEASDFEKVPMVRSTSPSRSK